MTGKYITIQSYGRYNRKSAIFGGHLLLLCLLLFFAGASAFADDRPFTGPANWGGTGLMETPTARIMTEGHYRFGVSQIKPYRYYYGTISPFEDLEIDGRVTEVLDVPTVDMPDYGNYKDKAIDVKYRVMPEGKWWPAIAVGIMDPHGTRLYSGQYIVMSKQFYPFDFTVGFGNGRFGERPLSPSGNSFKAEMFTDHSSWRRDGRFFGGIQFTPTDYLAFMVEYNPIKYEHQTTDPAQEKYFTDAVSSRFNFGIRFKPVDWLEATLSYQRGNRIGLNISADFELGKPLIPIYDPPYSEKPELFLRPAEVRIVEALHYSGFSSIGVLQDGNTMRIDAENDKYYYNMKAIQVALRATGEIIPAGIEKIYFTLTENGIPVLEFATAREDLSAFCREELTPYEFLYLSEFRTDLWKTTKSLKNHRSYLDYNIKPEFKMFLNDPSGFFKYRLGLLGRTFFTPWKGSTIVTGAVGYPLNTVSTSNEPLSRPVRSDIVAYQEKNLLLDMLLFNHIEKFKHEIHGRVAAGYLEEQYAGLDGEVAIPLFGGRITAGLAGSIVRKRDPDRVFHFKENDWKDYYKTAFFKLRLSIPEADVNIDLKNGQFLAGDRGTVITVSKNFKGVVISAWYSMTGTSMFNDPYNRGYHDKGIAVTIPFRLFTGKDTRTTHSISLSPWTRDVGQDINHYSELFDFIGRNTKVYIDKDKRMIQ